MPITKDNTRQMFNATRDEVHQFIERKALEIEREAKLSMRGGGSPHSPSRPGDPPHVDLGRLRNSITHEIESSRFQITAFIGTNVRYGFFLEVGTRFIEPRPWLRPAFVKVIQSTR